MGLPLLPALVHRRDSAIAGESRLDVIHHAKLILHGQWWLQLVAMGPMPMIYNRKFSGYGIWESSWFSDKMRQIWLLWPFEFTLLTPSSLVSDVTPSSCDTRQNAVPVKNGLQKLHFWWSHQSASPSPDSLGFLLCVKSSLIWGTVL